MAYTTINKSTDFFNTLLYTGNATDNRAITGVGFQPDFTWIKERNGTPPHLLQDAVRGADYQIYSNSEDVQTNDNNKVKSFNSDGFTIGTGTWINTNSDTYASWNWKAGGGQGSSNTDGSINTTYTSVNTTAGFSICQWTGTGSAGTIGHGLGVAPKMIIMKRTNGAVNDWVVYHESVGNNKALFLNVVNTPDTDSAYFNDTSPTSSVFSVKSSQTNNNGDNQIAYCFAEKTGYSKFGSYTGNGSTDGTFVYTGFKPAFVIFKQTDASRNWLLKDNKRPSYQNVNDTNIYPNTTAAEETPNSSLTDFLSNGFKIRNTGSFQNASGGSYIYMAFAAAPLVGTNNVPCTAR